MVPGGPDRLQLQLESSLVHRHRLCACSAPPPADVGQQNFLFSNTGAITPLVDVFITRVGYHWSSDDVVRQVCWSPRGCG
eukprot:766509-Hanusia_phi.AAC.1